MPVRGSIAGTLVLPAGAVASGAGGVLVKTVLPAAPKVGVTPFRVSLAITLVAEVPPVAPLGVVMLSTTAAIAAAGTVTVVVSGLQLVGFNFSHMVVTMV